MRGFDGFLLDLAAEPERAAAVMDRIQAYLFERTRAILEAGRGAIDMVEYNDDVGGQNGLIISPAMWREHLKPRMAAFVDLCRPYGAKVRYHSCGGIRAIIGDLIEIGIDVLNPVQTLAEGMEPGALKRDFGELSRSTAGWTRRSSCPVPRPTRCAARRAASSTPSAATAASYSPRRTCFRRTCRSRTSSPSTRPRSGEGCDADREGQSAQRPGTARLTLTASGR